MAKYEIPVVFDVESDPPEPLGIYDRADEDAIVYRAGSEFKTAPSDCVQVSTCVVIVR